MSQYKIPVIPGDGIGPEIIAEGRKVIDAAGEVYGFDVDWIDYPHGADHFLKTGELISEDTLKELNTYDNIYLGSIGDPRIAPGVLEKGILLAARFYFDPEDIQDPLLHIPPQPYLKPSPSQASQSHHQYQKYHYCRPYP